MKYFGRAIENHFRKADSGALQYTVPNAGSKLMSENTNSRPLDRTERREHFVHFLTIPTRWSDNDSYGHVNNARYLTFIELVIMRYLEVDSQLDFAKHGVHCFSVENMCRYHTPVKFPDTLEAGLRVGKLGNSSVRYEVGLFVTHKEEVSATGYFTDVFVDAKTERPVSIPDPIRTVLSALVL